MALRAKRFSYSAPWPTVVLASSSVVKSLLACCLGGRRPHRHDPGSSLRTPRDGPNRIISVRFAHAEEENHWFG
jgi:hypothetical protein